MIWRNKRALLYYHYCLPEERIRGVEEVSSGANLIRLPHLGFTPKRMIYEKKRHKYSIVITSKVSLHLHEVHNFFHLVFISRSGGIAAVPQYLLLSCGPRFDLEPSIIVYSSNSTSNLTTIRAIADMISCFAKCLPGQMPIPPPSDMSVISFQVESTKHDLPKGKKPPALPAMEN